MILLQGSGQRVSASSSIARRTPFDIVLTDLRLPDIPGELVIRQLLATAGRVVVLVKPFDWTALRGCLSPPRAAPKADAA